MPRAPRFRPVRGTPGYDRAADASSAGTWSPARRNTVKFGPLAAEGPPARSSAGQAPHAHRSPLQLFLPQPIGSQHGAPQPTGPRVSPRPPRFRPAKSPPAGHTVLTSRAPKHTLAELVRTRMAALASSNTRVLGDAQRPPGARVTDSVRLNNYCAIGHAGGRPALLISPGGTASSAAGTTLYTADVYIAN